MPPLRTTSVCTTSTPTANEQVARLRLRAHHLARGDSEIDGGSQRCVRVRVVRGERLLEPVRVQTLELSGKGCRGGEIPARSEISGHAPALVGVDHDLQLRADGVSNRLDHGQVDPPVRRVQSKLDRAYTCIPQREAAAHALIGRNELSARRIREESVPVASEESPQRLIVRASDEIPDRDLDDPVAAVVEVDALDDPVHRVGLLGIASDEQTLEQVAVGHPVAARVTLDPVVGADDHDRCVLMRSRLGIPCGRERRVERVAVDPRLDRRDAH